MANGTLDKLLIPLSGALDEMPTVTVNAEAAAALAQGGRSLVNDEIEDGELVSVLAPDGRLVCVAEIQRCAQGAELQPRRVFADSSPPAAGPRSARAGDQR